MTVVRSGFNDTLKQDVFDVRYEVFVHEQNVPEEEEIDEHDETARHFALYNEEGQAVGAGRMRLLDDAGKAERIAVRASFRKSGAGRQLMEAIEKEAAAEGKGKIKLHAQLQALPFYKSLGYTVTSEEFFDAGIPHHAMEKQL
ncbi:putative GNAT family N-acyltransferase [Salsuginibacillus halophilus]|uniref:Putative GNAT family N-acyltransferase n=1 Tax=Salsuginibacillus halophilus TaxID=517424 RepID=A0A2P8HXE0_9BACI|nr:GNAT family N-acetyltransferase [Salsuginibacillus halophilus]PSL50892.1 putative GNAT family N-acyltransferase [Salsuginibacillus halophilus]